MKKIGFIGAYDKIDLILYTAKILQTLGNKILIIDATVNQKAKYVVPTITPTVKYVTEFEDMDVAVGFENINEIEEYLGIEEGHDLEYDIALIDTDKPEGILNFELEKAEKKYFVTSFDAYSLKRGLEILGVIKSTMNLTKVLFTQEPLKEEDDYLNFLSLGYKVIWDEDRLYFPLDNADLSAIYENHRVGKIKLKKLSIQYKDGIAYIANQILDNKSDSEIRRAIKIIERGA